MLGLTWETSHYNINKILNIIIEMKFSPYFCSSTYNVFLLLQRLKWYTFPLTPMPYIIAIINEVSEISDSSFLQLTIILISLEPSKAY